jgi:prepilin-type N-terminal cleavage/methylation domain-containing protein
MQVLKPNTNNQRSQKAMTLVELMVVVVILTVLSTIAVNAYRAVVYQARNAEAYSFLGAIKASQNAYFQTYGQYSGTPGWATWPQGDPPFEKKVLWGEPNSDTWKHLGVKPQGPVWFLYRIEANTIAGTAPAESFTAPNVPTGPWFRAQANGDFDGDKILSTFEITSLQSAVYSEKVNE